MSINKWMGNENVAICKLEHYSAIKEKEIMKISGKSMDLERILSEIPKCRKKSYMFSFLCGS